MLNVPTKRSSGHKKLNPFFMTEPEFELQRSWMLTGTVLEPLVHISYIRGGEGCPESTLPSSHTWSFSMFLMTSNSTEIPYF